MWSTVVALVTCLSLPATNSSQRDSAIPGPQSGSQGTKPLVGCPGHANETQLLVVELGVWPLTG